jgi:hypothetical protein
MTVALPGIRKFYEEVQRYLGIFLSVWKIFDKCETLQLSKNGIF